MPCVRRLKTRRQFLEVAAARRKWVTPGLILQAMSRPSPREGEEHVGSGLEAEAIGLGFTVSRKVGNAVARNRAKRRLKAAAAEIIPLEGRPGCDYVIIGRKETLDRTFADLVNDLRKAVAGVGTKKETPRRARRGSTRRGAGG